MKTLKISFSNTRGNSHPRKLYMRFFSSWTLTKSIVKIVLICSLHVLDRNFIGDDVLYETLNYLSLSIPSLALSTSSVPGIVKDGLQLTHTHISSPFDLLRREYFGCSLIEITKSNFSWRSKGVMKCQSNITNELKATRLK